MSIEELFLLGVLAAMIAGVTIIVLALRQRAFKAELVHRERMAMIERGIAPPPEMSGPFHPMGATAPGAVTFQDQRRGTASRSQMTFGIVLMGAGFAFMAVIGIAARSPEVAVGLGGAAVIFGVALIIISQVVRQPDHMTMTTSVQRPAPMPPMTPASLVPPVPPAERRREDEGVS